MVDEADLTPILANDRASVHAESFKVGEVRRSGDGANVEEGKSEE
jgi:hypothetical protein